MASFYCPRGHGSLQLVHESLGVKTYKCASCGYRKTQKTAGGWALDIGKAIAGGIVSGVVGHEIGDLMGHHSDDFTDTDSLY